MWNCNTPRIYVLVNTSRNVSASMQHQICQESDPYKFAYYMYYIFKTLAYNTDG